MCNKRLSWPLFKDSEDSGRTFIIATAFKKGVYIVNESIHL